MFCSKCGLQSSDSAKFCSGCGSAHVGNPVSNSDAIEGAYPSETKVTPEQINLNSGKSSAELVYLMYALSFIFVIPAFIGIFIAYGKVNELNGTYLESHFQWQIQTFWRYFGLCVFVMGVLFFPIPISGESILAKLGIGIVLAIAGGIWLIYRIVKGWVRLSEFKAI